MAAGSPRRNGFARALALLVALVVLFVSLSAEAKKKKGGKKHKTPATKSKGKEALPATGDESDEASSDEKSSGKDDEEEEKPKATPPPEPVGGEEEAAAKPAKKSKPAPKAEDEAAEGGLAALRIVIGGGALFRQLRWTDDMGALAPYTLSPGPELRVQFEAFPAAFATDGFAANIGLFGKLDYGFGASSKTPPPANQTLTTKYMDFLGGLKVRIPLGVAVPYVAGAYGMQKFTLTPADPSRPNFNYSFVQIGGGARFQFTPEFDLDVGAAFLYVMNPGASTGEIKALYPRATANGIDAFLSVGYRVMSMLAVRVGVDFRQFGVATGWRAGDAAIRAGGAVDRNITPWGGLEVVFDGIGGGGESAAPPPKKAEKPKKAPAESEEGGEPAVEDSSEK